MKTSISSGEVWAQRYENLRQDFLEGSRLLECPSIGLLLLIRDGLAIWMRAWNQKPDSSVEPCNPIAPILTPTSGWQRELTFLLAHLTKLHLQPIPR